MAALLVIADHPDPLADDMAKRITARGWAVERRDHAGAALTLSVARDGGAPRVTPSVPIFLRLPLGGSRWEETEAQFHRAERRSLVWAATALATAPVVNRPDAFGLASRALGPGEVLRRRAGLAAGMLEIFSSACPKPPDAALDWWIESATDRIARPWTADPGRGPFRAGAARVDLDQHVVVMAGNHAAGAPNDDLATLSRDVCRRLGVAFAALSWRVGDGVTELIRIDPHPRPEHVAGFEDEIVDGLLAVLDQ